MVSLFFKLLSMFCPNLKNPEVKKEFEKLVSALGENVAYDVWNKNNGNFLDKLPNGEENTLYTETLKKFGDEDYAIKYAAIKYADTYYNKENHFEELNKNFEKAEKYNEARKKGVKELLEILIANTTNPIHKELAEILYNNYIKNDFVSVELKELDINEVTEALKNEGTLICGTHKFDNLNVLKNTAGDIKLRSIVEYTDFKVVAFYNKNYESTILHELIHVITVFNYKVDSKFKNILDDLFNYSLNSLSADDPKRSLYGFSSPLEFIAEAFTSMKFIEVLKNIPYKENVTTPLIKNSVFQKLLDAVSNFFNLAKFNKVSLKTTILNILNPKNVKVKVDNTVLNNLAELLSVSKLEHIYSDYTGASNTTNEPAFSIEQVEEDLKNKYLTVTVQDLIDNGEIIYTDDEGNPCAANGLTNTVTGTNWKIVKDFKGQPKHSQGGVDITISDKGVTMRRGGKDIKAAHGLVVPKIDNPEGDKTFTIDNTAPFKQPNKADKMYDVTPPYSSIEERLKKLPPEDAKKMEELFNAEDYSNLKDNDYPDELLDIFPDKFKKVKNYYDNSYFYTTNLNAPNATFRPVRSRIDNTFINATDKEELLKAMGIVNTLDYDLTSNLSNPNYQDKSKSIKIGDDVDYPVAGYMRNSTATEEAIAKVSKYAAKYGIEPEKLLASMMIENSGTARADRYNNTNELQKRKLVKNYGFPNVAFRFPNELTPEIIIKDLGYAMPDGNHNYKKGLEKMYKIFDNYYANPLKRYEDFVEPHAEYISLYGLEGVNPKQQTLEGVKNSYVDMIEEGAKIIKSKNIFK